ncbi:FhaA domain-containing protein [Streptomyces sp. NPDC051001]|uniref:FhaA domain-containing protein n=1 Tax=Streptomyces sp. NPDC051001 TaxID=3155795 RepID=UPI003426D820
MRARSQSSVGWILRPLFACPEKLRPSLLARRHRERVHADRGDRDVRWEGADTYPPYGEQVVEQPSRPGGQARKMRSLAALEHTMERWSNALWTSLIPLAHKQYDHADVVRTLYRECDDRALILDRRRVLVPNAFVIELPPQSHQQLAGTSRQLGAHLSSHVRRHGPGPSAGERPAVSPAPSTPPAVSACYSPLGGGRWLNGAGRRGSSGSGRRRRGSRWPF